MQRQKITIQDIARRAKVSKSTVSRVINKSPLVKDDKRAAVIDAMESLDFQPNLFARGLAGGRSMAIGVLTQDIGSPFYDSVAQAVTTGLRDTSYSPIFVDGEWSAEVEESAIDTLIGRRVEGIILIGGSIPVEELEKIQSEIPIVVVAREIPDWTDNCIFIDNYQGAYEATRYLIESGHQDIAFISGILNHQDGIRRRQGFLEALVDSNIAFNEKLFAEGNFRASSGVEAAESLLQSGERFTAIFSCNDEMAFGARLALYRHGIKVPEDVSIIGFDDQPMSAFMTPPLTTVKQPALELGITAAQTLVHILDEEPYTIPLLTTELIVRESVLRR